MAHLDLRGDDHDIVAVTPTELVLTVVLIIENLALIASGFRSYTTE